MPYKTPLMFTSIMRSRSSILSRSSAVQYPHDGDFAGSGCDGVAGQPHRPGPFGELPQFYEDYAVPADSFARAVAFAIEQPEDVDINEILCRPTSRSYRRWGPLWIRFCRPERIYSASASPNEQALGNRAYRVTCG
jgi:hypothetical protein